MTFNSQEIIRDVRTEFEDLLDYVTGEKAQHAKADSIERGLFKMLLSLGAKLLQLFFVMHSQTCSRAAFQDKDGEMLPYHHDSGRVYFSIFGKVSIERAYFYKPGAGGQTPLDADLGLGDDNYSDFVREVTEYFAIYPVYGGKSADLLERLLGLKLSTRALQQNIAEDSASVAEYYAQKSPPKPESEAEILVIQADGKGQKHGHKKEAIVTAVYANPRTASEVSASFFEETQAENRPKKVLQPQNKHIWATMDGKEVALSRLSIQVALCNGCEALQSRIVLQFQSFTLILDFVHANEYLWDTANSLLGETSEKRCEWVKLDLPLFFVLSFVPFVSFVVDALNKVIDDANLKKRICKVILLQPLKSKRSCQGSAHAKPKNFVTDFPG